MAKKNNYRKTKKSSKKREEEVVEKQSIWHVITVSGCIILFLCFFYFMTLYLTRNERESKKKDDDTNSVSTFSKTETIIGRSLDMSDGEYYVLCYDTTDEDISSVYSEIVNNYNAKGDITTLYTVDMGNVLNKGYASDSSNTSPTTAEEIKINGPTLMKVNNHQVVLYIEGEEGIRNSLS